HLDLFPPSGPAAGKARSLLEVIDLTLTPMGGRLLRRWLASPLRQAAAIRARQDKVEFFMEGKEARRNLRAMMQGWPDLERILTRLAAGSSTPRDLAALGQGLRRLPRMKNLLDQMRRERRLLGPASAGED